MKSNREIRAEAKAMREQAASDKAAEEQVINMCLIQKHI